MKKYLLIVLLSIGILEFLTIIIYWDELTAYIANSVAGIGNGIAVIAIYLIGFILLFKAIL